MDCSSPCECENNRSEAVSMVRRIVEDLMWKVCDMDADKSEPLMMKLFSVLWKATDIKSLGEKLIQYEAALKIKKLNDAVENDDEEESEELDLVSLFN